MSEHLERFMKKVRRLPGDACWEWLGSTTGSGYGHFWFKGKMIPAHWVLLDSPPQAGMEACHKCDNRLCVRPSHIFIGTHSSNMRDMVNKGRHNPAAKAYGCRKMLAIRNMKGIRNHQATLSEEQAMLAKACPSIRGAAVTMAKAFGVIRDTIYLVRNGKNWKHLPAPSEADKARALEFIQNLREAKP